MTTTAPHPGERCSCGRPAVMVFVVERFGRVGWCGVETHEREGGAG